MHKLRAGLSYRFRRLQDKLRLLRRGRAGVQAQSQHRRPGTLQGAVLLARVLSKFQARAQSVRGIGDEQWLDEWPVQSKREEVILDVVANRTRLRNRRVDGAGLGA